MIEPSKLALFFAAALVLAITPGPGLFYVAARTLAGGRKDGIASSLGTGLGGMVHVIAGSLGLSALILANAELFSALKLIGALYLVWLGVRTIKNATDAQQAGEVFGAVTPQQTMRKAFREGVIVEAANPKTAAFFLAFIPQFIEPAQGSVAVPFLVLGFVSVVLNTAADLGIVFLAHRIKSNAAAHPHLVGHLKTASGGLIVALGIGLALVDQSD